jgi:hypothetical protein
MIPLQHISGMVSEALRSIRYRSVVHPLLWLTAIISPLALCLAFFSDADRFLFFFALACLPPAMLGLAYLGWSLVDADRLHSEEFQLQNRSLEIVESKAGGLVVNPVELQAVLNPYTDDSQRKRLGPGGKS